MPAQDHFWSLAAKHYEKEYVDPFRADVKNPLLKVLARLAKKTSPTIADLGCGIGPLLPFLADHFARVYAVDFAAGMLDRASERCGKLAGITFMHRPLTDLTPLAGSLDVAVAVNSLVMPDVRDIEASLEQVRLSLRPRGQFLGIVPAMDGVDYFTMLLLDRALAQGKPPDIARKNAAHFGDHEHFDFAFGQFSYKGLEQHFWQPFEIRHRFEQSGLRVKHLRRVRLSWQQFSCHKELKTFPPPWDWFFWAERK